uniref:Uncharacterized protein n=1 Tax=Nelumbo nucifera TaxID=4432 RepID=A0A822Y304_NELNU|nr:TPA_asm: hypothetical protein HUJ06_027013 [Nelumbo nucifera]DAD25626.1 TPA_asm: hypothetical protein HUJ06_027090 [Nelumbo nucifera]
MPIYFLSGIPVPSGVMKTIENLFMDFWWGSEDGRKKCHWLSFDRISLPTTEGGLGLRKLSDIATAFRMKLGWKLIRQTCLWADFFIHKYCRNTPLWLLTDKPGDSKTLKEICGRIRDIMMGSKWLIGNGQKKDFLFHPPLIEFALDRPNHRLMKKDVLNSEGDWNLNSVENLLPPNILDSIHQSGFYTSPNTKVKT